MVDLFVDTSEASQRCDCWAMQAHLRGSYHYAHEFNAASPIGLDTPYPPLSYFSTSYARGPSPNRPVISKMDGAA
jgi:hypothetical protein